MLFFRKCTFCRICLWAVCLWQYVALVGFRFMQLSLQKLASLYIYYFYELHWVGYASVYCFLTQILWLYVCNTCDHYAFLTWSIVMLCTMCVLKVMHTLICPECMKKMYLWFSVWGTVSWVSLQLGVLTWGKDSDRVFGSLLQVMSEERVIFGLDFLLLLHQYLCGGHGCIK